MNKVGRRLLLSDNGSHNRLKIEVSKQSWRDDNEGALFCVLLEAVIDVEGI